MIITTDKEISIIFYPRKTLLPCLLQNILKTL